MFNMVSDETLSLLFRAFLQLSNKFELLMDLLPKPDPDDARFSASERCNTLVLSWINRSDSPDIVISTIWIDCAADAWKDLRD